MKTLNDFSLTNGTSFQGVTIRTTINELQTKFGEPIMFDNSGDDKVNVEWAGVTSEGYVFTIYSWKEYRPLGLDEKVEFHIGSKSSFNSKVAKSELLNLLNA